MVVMVMMLMLLLLLLLLMKVVLLYVQLDDLFAHRMQTYVTWCRSRGILIPLLGVALTPSTVPHSQALDVGCFGPWQISQVFSLTEGVPPGLPVYQLFL